MKIGVLGSGEVGQTLAAGFLKHGYEVMIGSREPAKLTEWQKANPKSKVGTFSDTAAFGEVLVLAVGGGVAANALRMAEKDSLAGKVVIDACNPISGAPDHGVLPLFTKSSESLMEQLQKEFPEARFVKAFNSVGAAQMVNPSYPGGIRPTMFICGNDGPAKATVSGFLNQFGWDTADMGGVESARAIEPLCVLWCILGFRKNEWTHAFKLLRK
jgi:predicted dinucleotide-binding enzyme